MYPINFLKYLVGKTFIIKDFCLKKDQLRAIGEALKDLKLDIVILKNNLLSDEHLSFFLNFLLKCEIKYLSLEGNSIGPLTCFNLYEGYFML